ncbi:MAG TPA: hypothetical protein VK469_23445 [Candidatus Kapabacteria bacterium]|nr:hypothetical protein [Candidatus Kapabacteria bacterium]
MSSESLREKKNIPANPFIYNSPVRGADFYNRDVIIDRLLKETVTGKTLGNVWITGERQVGKTSLLRCNRHMKITMRKFVYTTGKMIILA